GSSARAGQAHAAPASRLARAGASSPIAAAAHQAAASEVDSAGRRADRISITARRVAGGDGGCVPQSAARPDCDTDGLAAVSSGVAASRRARASQRADTPGAEGQVSVIERNPYAYPGPYLKVC